MNKEAIEWLRQQVTDRLEQARRADTGERWEADRHYDALYCVDMKPSAGPVDTADDLREASLGAEGLHDFENPRFLWAGVFQACHAALNDPQDAIARCEAELAILDEHYILWAAGSGVSTDESYDEFSVVPIGGANRDHGCVTCHYYGMGGVKGHGICRTVKAVAAGYRHREGYAEHWGEA